MNNELNIKDFIKYNIIFSVSLTIIFIIVKILGILQFSWMQVFCPIWGIFLLILTIIVLIIIIEIIFLIFIITALIGYTQWSFFSMIVIDGLIHNYRYKKIIKELIKEGKIKKSNDYKNR
jgi:hypothetical protein